MKYGKKDNEIADRLRNACKDFLLSREWKALRKVVLAHYGPQCMRCKYTPKKWECVNVDHIKPRLHYPELALDPGNLQVLCSRCNKGKGNKNSNDYRPIRGRLCFPASAVTTNL